jgi:hypothetical protein
MLVVCREVGRVAVLLRGDTFHSRIRGRVEACSGRNLQTQQLATDSVVHMIIAPLRACMNAVDVVVASCGPIDREGAGRSDECRNTTLQLLQPLAMRFLRRMSIAAR